jgi:Tfp pilus assembly protein PilF
LLSQGFVSEAEKEFREAVSFDPANALAHAGLARVLESSNDVIAARSEAEAALHLKSLAEPLLVLARLDLRENKFEAAAQEVSRALQLEPSNPAAQALKNAVAAKLAEKAQPLPKR